MTYLNGHTQKIGGSSIELLAAMFPGILALRLVGPFSKMDWCLTLDTTFKYNLAKYVYTFDHVVFAFNLISCEANQAPYGTPL